MSTSSRVSTRFLIPFVVLSGPTPTRGLQERRGLCGNPRADADQTEVLRWYASSPW